MKSDNKEEFIFTFCIKIEKKWILTDKCNIIRIINLYVCKNYIHVQNNISGYLAYE